MIHPTKIDNFAQTHNLAEDYSSGGETQQYWANFARTVDQAKGPTELIVGTPPNTSIQIGKIAIDPSHELPAHATVHANTAGDLQRWEAIATQPQSTSTYGSSRI